MAAYIWGTPVDIEVRLDAEDARRQFEVKLEKDRKETLAVYLDGESIVGQVCHIFHPLYLFMGFIPFECDMSLLCECVGNRLQSDYGMVRSWHTMVSRLSSLGALVSVSFHVSWSNRC